MIGELTTNHGQLTEALQKKIDAVVDEFSLDKEDSALSRLVRNVERHADDDHQRVFARQRESRFALATILQSTRQASTAT